MEILTKRPTEMSFADYREHMKIQSKYLKQRCSFSIPYYISWKEVPNDSQRTQDKRYITNPPFRGSVRRDLTRPA